MKRQSKVKSLLVVAALVALSGVATVGVAKGHPFEMRGPAMGEKLIKKLELTEAQQEQVRGLKERYRAEHKESRKAMKVQMDRFKDLERAGASDAELKAQADVMAGMMSEKMVERALQMRELRAILTAEQRVKMDQLMDERKQHHLAKKKEMQEKRAAKESVTE